MKALMFLLRGAVLFPAVLAAGDQAQWGAAWGRNMVSAERGLPAEIGFGDGRNVRWQAALGTESHGTPVVSGGRVFMGTNNGVPRDAKHEGDRGVLMAFAESDGRFLWQLVVPKRSEDPYFDWPKSGISSPATVEGERVYVVTNRGEVVCLDAAGLANGNQGPYRDEARHMSPAGEPPREPGEHDADILWITDLTAVAGIWSHDAAHSSILIDGENLILNSGTGVDNTHRKIRRPEAPGLVVLDKASGKLVARDRENVSLETFHCNWSAPSLAESGGVRRLFFCGGNGMVYAFAPPGEDRVEGVTSLRRLWMHDPDPEAPKQDVHRYNQNRQEGPSNVFGMPVCHEGRLYVAGGGDLWWGKTSSWLQCLDQQSGKRLWTAGLGKHVMSTPAVSGELCFIADTDGIIYCFHAVTGREFWRHETRGDYWASPLVADGRIYLGSRKGGFLVLAADRRGPTVLSEAQAGSPVSATAVAANRRLFIATMTTLYCAGVAE
jgi:outer membrane protein assembly factor BamB